MLQCLALGLVYVVIRNIVFNLSVLSQCCLSHLKIPDLTPTIALGILNSPSILYSMDIFQNRLLAPDEKNFQTLFNGEDHFKKLILFVNANKNLALSLATH